MLSQDRNPNTNGAKIILGLEGKTGANLEAIAASVAEGRIKALVVLGEDPTEFGITVEQLKKLPSFITMNILRNAATAHATAILPSAAYAEKRGSMINGRGRLQRLNRAVRLPGQAREIGRSCAISCRNLPAVMVSARSRMCFVKWRNRFRHWQA